MMSNSILRVVQMILAVMGLTFSLTGVIFVAFVIAYVMIVIYEIFIAVSMMAGRQMLTQRTHSIMEVVLGIIILVVSIYCTIEGEKDVWKIADIAIGFIIAPLLFITAYG